MQSPFDREDLQAPLAEINTTPLVDVMLVLLVIFLVTAPMLNSAIKLNLPSETAAQISEQKTLTISVNKSGQYFLDDASISNDELERKLELTAKDDPKQPIHIRADVEVSYGKVSHVLAIAQRFGLTNVGFVTEPK
jgi:biopolymer transport protein ExbD